MQFNLRQLLHRRRFLQGGGEACCSSVWRLRLGALIMGKIDHETILTQTHLHPVIIYVVLNLQICLLLRTSN